MWGILFSRKYHDKIKELLVYNKQGEIWFDYCCIEYMYSLHVHGISRQFFKHDIWLFS